MFPWRSLRPKMTSWRETPFPHHKHASSLGVQTKSAATVCLASKENWTASPFAAHSGAVSAVERPVISRLSQTTAKRNAASTPLSTPGICVILLAQPPHASSAVSRNQCMKYLTFLWFSDLTILTNKKTTTIHDAVCCFCATRYLENDARL